MKTVRCLIPAAGKGTRMRPLTHTLPKAMLPVAGKPTIYHIIDAAYSAGVEKFSIITGYLREKMEAEILTAYPNLDIRFVEQKSQLGLGHAIYEAKDEFSADESMLLIYGDTLFEADLSPFLNSDKPIIGVYPVEDPRRFGVVELAEDNETIVNFVEKPEVPPSNLAIPGVNFFPDPKILFDAMGEIIAADIRTKNEYQITDAFLKLVQQKITMKAVKLKGWFDCGTLEEILATNKILLEKFSSKLPSSIHESVSIHAPVSIGENCSLKNCEIGPYVSLGDNCIIENSKISDCIIDKGTAIQNSKLNHSIVGRNVKVQSASGKFILGDDCQVEAYD